MIRYNSVVEEHLIYEIEGDWIQLKYLEQMEKFRISKRLAEGSLFVELKPEIRDEVEHLIEAVQYMQQEHRGVSKLNQLSKIAGLLHISYGDLRVKINNGELTDFGEIGGVPKWIPISEKLPEDAEPVLCAVTTQAGLRTMHIGFYNNYGKKWHAGKGSNVVAWMPLPEIYSN